MSSDRKIFSNYGSDKQPLYESAEKIDIERVLQGCRELRVEYPDHLSDAVPHGTTFYEYFLLEDRFPTELVEHYLGMGVNLLLELVGESEDQYTTQFDEEQLKYLESRFLSPNTPVISDLFIESIKRASTPEEAVGLLNMAFGDGVPEEDIDLILYCATAPMLLYLQECEHRVTNNYIEPYVQTGGNHIIATLCYENVAKICYGRLGGISGKLSNASEAVLKPSEYNEYRRRIVNETFGTMPGSKQARYLEGLTLSELSSLIGGHISSAFATANREYSPLQFHQSRVKSMSSGREAMLERRLNEWLSKGPTAVDRCRAYMFGKSNQDLVRKVIYPYFDRYGIDLRGVVDLDPAVRELVVEEVATSPDLCQMCGKKTMFQRIASAVKKCVPNNDMDLATLRSLCGGIIPPHLASALGWGTPIKSDAFYRAVRLVCECSPTYDRFGLRFLDSDPTSEEAVDRLKNFFKSSGLGEVIIQVGSHDSYNGNARFIGTNLLCSISLPDCQLEIGGDETCTLRFKNFIPVEVQIVSPVSLTHIVHSKHARHLGERLPFSVPIRYRGKDYIVDGDPNQTTYKILADAVIELHRTVHSDDTPGDLFRLFGEFKHFDYDLSKILSVGLRKLVIPGHDHIEGIAELGIGAVMPLVGSGRVEGERRNRLMPANSKEILDSLRKHYSTTGAIEIGLHEYFSEKPDVVVLARLAEELFGITTLWEILERKTEEISTQKDHDGDSNYIPEEAVYEINTLIYRGMQRLSEMEKSSSSRSINPELVEVFKRYRNSHLVGTTIAYIGSVFTHKMMEIRLENRNESGVAELIEYLRRRPNTSGSKNLLDIYSRNSGSSRFKIIGDLNFRIGSHILDSYFVSGEINELALFAILALGAQAYNNEFATENGKPVSIPASHWLVEFFGAKLFSDLLQIEVSKSLSKKS